MLRKRRDVVAARMKALRATTGLGVDTFAAIFDAREGKRKQVRRWEAGTADPSDEDLEKLFHWLSDESVRRAWLLDGRADCADRGAQYFPATATAPQRIVLSDAPDPMGAVAAVHRKWLDVADPEGIERLVEGIHSPGVSDAEWNARLERCAPAQSHSPRREMRSWQSEGCERAATHAKDVQIHGREAIFESLIRGGGEWAAGYYRLTRHLPREEREEFSRALHDSILADLATRRQDRSQEA